VIDENAQLRKQMQADSVKHAEQVHQLDQKIASMQNEHARELR